MSKWLAFCLLVVPFTQGLSIVTDNAPTLAVLKGHRELEKEIHSNITKLSSESVFLPPASLNENGEVSPLHVKVNTYVRDVSIKNIDKDLYDWTLDLTFRQKWNDKRLAYDITEHPDYAYIPLNSASAQKSIWKPDTFFSKSVTGELHHLLAPNSLVWVYPNGDVLYSIRLSVTLRCHPENATVQEEGKKEKEDDTLICPMRVASYGYTTDKLVYEWDEEPVQLKQDLYIPHYTIDKVVTDAGTSKTKIGEFSTIKAKFHFSHH